jgi:hypothetical protein
MTWLDTVTGKGRVTVRDLEWLPLEFICFHLRAEDSREIYGNLPSDNPLELAAMVFHAVGKKGVGWIANFDGRPTGAFGAFENWQGNWQVFSFGTHDYRRVVVTFKAKLDAAIKFALENGARRLECKSHAAHKEAHALLRVVGFECETVMRSYGRDGADYLLFSKAWDHDGNPRTLPPKCSVCAARI